MAGPSDRTRRWLGTFGDPDQLGRSFASATVQLTAADGDSAAEVAIAMAATLLLRLDDAAPILFIDGPQGRTRAIPRLGDGALVEMLAREHTGFRSTSRLFAGHAPDCLIHISFGRKRPGALTVDSGGWDVAVGSDLPDVGNPLAAAYVGVLAASEVVKALLDAAGVHHRRIRPWTGVASLWNHQLGTSAGPAIPDTVDLAGAYLIGCGGICAALAWTLALLPLAGCASAIDDDVLDDTNLNRHIIAGYDELEASKAGLVADLLTAAGADVQPIPSTWQDLGATFKAGCTLGVISVDHDPTRREVQFDLPRLLLNAGNADTGLYRVTRHDFIEGACLACISHGDGRSSGAEESAARRLGLSLADVRPFLENNTPFPSDLLGRASLTDAERHRLRGKRARTALGIVCGEFSPAPDQPALSAPTLAAAPGVLLAVEFVKHVIGDAPSLGRGGNHLAASILAGPHRRWSSVMSKLPSCSCQDDVYRSFYARKWGL